MLGVCYGSTKHPTLNGSIENGSDIFRVAADVKKVLKQFLTNAHLAMIPKNLGFRGSTSFTT